MSKAQLNIQKEIEKRNSLFKKATKAEKRVLIAKDVIAQIKANRYVATSGAFVEAEFNSDIDDFSHILNEAHYLMGAKLKEADVAVKYNISLEKAKEGINFVKKPLREAYLDGTVESCNVCALGGLFMSCTLYNNKTKLDALGRFGEASDLGDFIDQEEPISNGLDKFFSRSQLELIEQAFEGGDGYFGDGCYTHDAYNDDGRNYYTYADKYPKDNDLMIAIMDNIVKNNGTFVPEKFKIVCIKNDFFYRAF